MGGKRCHGAGLPETKPNVVARKSANETRRVLLLRQGPICRSVDVGHRCVVVMSVSIQSCPSCRTLLLTDTVQCPLCQHVVNPEAAESFTGELPDAVAVEDRGDGVECGDCGEVVRPELVRCWRCGAFLRPEIAARFQEMQRNPSAVIYSQDSSSGDQENTALLSDQQSNNSAGPSLVDDGDFELADGVNMSDGDGFDLGDDLLKHTEPMDDDEEAAGAGDTDSAPDVADDSEGASEEATDTSHPVAASGDALLDIAMKEEVESKSRKRQGASSVTRGGARAVAKTGFIVFCPNGHPIEVQERHRGKSGKCPKCESPFLVPQQNWDPAQGGGAVDEVPEEVETEKIYVDWLDDVRLHQVDPGSLKLKVGSLEAKFDTVDVGFSAETVVLVKLVKSGGLFGGGAAKKIPAVRESVRLHLEDVQSTDGLPAAEFVSLAAETCGELRIVQPAPYAHESMFAGIDVFGTGRIGIRLPDDSASKTIDFLSFNLSEFRRVSRWMAALYGIADFGADVGVPLEDTFSERTCHYNEETTMTVVEDATYYSADETYSVTVVGHRCESCGLVVSSDARKKEKIGGKSGKGMAKAVCPKCKRLFGENPLYSITTDAVEEEGVEDQHDANVEPEVSASAGDDVSDTELQDDPEAAGDDADAGDDGE